MQLREYMTSDCDQLARLFFQTVHSVNAKDYTIIAIDNGEIVGFGDIDSSGYLDRLFVHKNHQHKGIATAICDELESSVTGKKIITHSSITAKPFFEKRGYRVKKEQTVVRNGISLTNFIMEK